MKPHALDQSCKGRTIVSTFANHNVYGSTPQTGKKLHCSTVSDANVDPYLETGREKRLRASFWAADANVDTSFQDEFVFRFRSK